MVLLSTLDAKSYSEELVAEIPEILCPDPSCLGCLLRGHGPTRASALSKNDPPLLGKTDPPLIKHSLAGPLVAGRRRGA